MVLFLIITIGVPALAAGTAFLVALHAGSYVGAVPPRAPLGRRGLS